MVLNLMLLGCNTLYRVQVRAKGERKVRVKKRLKHYLAVFDKTLATFETVPDAEGTHEATLQHAHHAAARALALALR